MRLDEVAAARADVDHMLAELRAQARRDDDREPVSTAVYHELADDMGLQPAAAAEVTRELPAAAAPSPVADVPPWWAVDLHRRLTAVEAALNAIWEAT